MKIYDTVKKEEVEIDGTEGLIQIMKDGRQVDLYLKEKKSDEDGYMSWDVEHWSTVDNKRFIRCYSLEGKVLSESTGHNIYDLRNESKYVEKACLLFFGAMHVVKMDKMILKGFHKKNINSVDKSRWECYLNSRKVLALENKEC